MTKAELYQKACMLPLLPGVYIIRDKTDTIIYIGKAKRLRTRVSQSEKFIPAACLKAVLR